MFSQVKNIVQAVPSIFALQALIKQLQYIRYSHNCSFIVHIFIWSEFYFKKLTMGTPYKMFIWNLYSWRLNFVTEM